MNLSRDRHEVLLKAVADFTGDEKVRAIYLGGSLAKGNYDNYSDIDLHIIVEDISLEDFIRNKRQRSLNWGNVLFFEDSHPDSPVVVAHFDSFVKADTWYKTKGQVKPSIWLKGLEVLYDPGDILTDIFEESSRIEIVLDSEAVEFWKGKILAFYHETYRAVMRKDWYYALANLDRVRWLIAGGWYMEAGNHLDSSYGVWSKVEGERSLLNERQLSLLAKWHCKREKEQILGALTLMFPEVMRLYRVLHKKAGLETDEEEFRRIIEMVL
ncbi:aminoglycoside 6-adenylyltransferase [Mesobacillus sp. AQ2]|uniref:aminoglycoside 6-adenylyltransferase n=1 Tax=Bacillaceae TaxID=186817 RepID=UPI00119FDA7E|nr:MULTISPECIES: aminoglycoside 6-adenylyltransferase [Bacillaceae]WHX42422.1 aminoglycoside 6-adenylyltransferase [Mesobacillus sp. AQ2]